MEGMTTSSKPSIDPVFRRVGIFCVIVGLAGCAVVLAVTHPFETRLSSIGSALVTLIWAVIWWCVPVTHTIGGVLMLHGSLRAATSTALVTLGGTVIVIYLAVYSAYPLFIGLAVNGTVTFVLLAWAIFRVRRR
jgi:hypothetical protein